VWNFAHPAYFLKKNVHSADKMEELVIASGLKSHVADYIFRVDTSYRWDGISSDHYFKGRRSTDSTADSADAFCGSFFPRKSKGGVILNG
jgi:hypothetical protein